MLSRIVAGCRVFAHFECSEQRPEALWGVQTHGWPFRTAKFTGEANFSLVTLFQCSEDSGNTTLIYIVYAIDSVYESPKQSMH